MKILLDCVVTASDPAKCSSNIQFLTFVRRTLETRPDVFFYWLIPDRITEEQFEATYPQHQNVRYVRVPQHKDRTKEYLTVSKQLDQALAFNGDFWDFDVLLTMRTGLVPLFKLLMNSPRTPGLAWLKEVWLIEEMPLMDFKKTVLTINRDVQDMYTLGGYLAADRCYILSYHEKPEIVKRARDFLTPSNVLKIAGKIQPVLTMQSAEYRLKSSDEYPSEDKPFCVAYSGRMEKANRIKEINNLMTKQFVLKGHKVKLLVTTVSEVTKVFDESIIDVKQAGRDEFWQLAKETMHVFVIMNIEGGLLLALVEPMMLGVPAIIMRAPWSTALFGEDYPFFVNNEVEAHAFISMFYDDYPKMYEQWSEWHLKTFRPLMDQRFASDLLYAHLDQEIARFQTTRAKFKETNPNKETNVFVADVLEQVGTGDEFVFSEVVEQMVAAKKADKKMLDKLQGSDRDERGLVWSTAWNDFRVILQVFHGWADASTKVGHMRRSSI